MSEIVMPDPAQVQQRIDSCEQELRALRRLHRAAKAAAVARRERANRSAAQDNQADSSTW